MRQITGLDPRTHHGFPCSFSPSGTKGLWWAAATKLCAHCAHWRCKVSPAGMYSEAAQALEPREGPLEGVTSWEFTDTDRSSQYATANHRGWPCTDRPVCVCHSLPSFPAGRNAQHKVQMFTFPTLRSRFWYVRQLYVTPGSTTQSYPPPRIMSLSLDALPPQSAEGFAAQQATAPSPTLVLPGWWPRRVPHRILLTSPMGPAVL